MGKPSFEAIMFKQKLRTGWQESVLVVFNKKLKFICGWDWYLCYRKKKKNTQNLGFCTSGSQLAKNAQIL